MSIIIAYQLIMFFVSTALNQFYLIILYLNAIYLFPLIATISKRTATFSERNYISYFLQYFDHNFMYHVLEYLCASWTTGQLDRCTISRNNTTNKNSKHIGCFSLLNPMFKRRVTHILNACPALDIRLALSPFVFLVGVVIIRSYVSAVLCRYPLVMNY